LLHSTYFITSCLAVIWTITRWPHHRSEAPTEAAPPTRSQLRLERQTGTHAKPCPKQSRFNASPTRQRPQALQQEVQFAKRSDNITLQVPFNHISFAGAPELALTAKTIETSWRVKVNYVPRNQVQGASQSRPRHPMGKKAPGSIERKQLVQRR
jgi:hypothetical protein